MTIRQAVAVICSACLIVLGASVVIACASEGANNVSTSDDTEIKLTTQSIQTEAGTAVCVIALNTMDSEAPGMSCTWPNYDG